jgi:hypothetical protein
MQQLTGSSISGLAQHQHGPTPILDASPFTQAQHVSVATTADAGADGRHTGSSISTELPSAEAADSRSVDVSPLVIPFQSGLCLPSASETVRFGTPVGSRSSRSSEPSEEPFSARDARYRNAFIDNLKVWLPYEGHSKIDGGTWTWVPFGGRETEGTTPLRVENERGTSIAIRTTTRGYLEVSGSFAKFLQGHNLGGLSDPTHLIWAGTQELLAICEDRFELHPTEDELHMWQRGEGIIIRSIECTGQVDCGSASAAHSVLATLKESHHPSLRRHTTEDHSSYYNLGSPRTTLKIYDKGAELRAPGRHHGLPQALPNRNSLELFAQGIVRMEVLLKSTELRKRHLDQPGNWSQDTAGRIVREFVDGLRFNDNQVIPSEAPAGMNRKERKIYKSWKHGDDFSDYSRGTIRKYRKLLLNYGVDISVPYQGHVEQHGIIRRSVRDILNSPFVFPAEDIWWLTI